MEAELAAFLAPYTPFDVESTAWADGTMPLSIASYSSGLLPPVKYITSVRALVLRDVSVLVLRNRDSIHIMPGGRREPDESIEETLRRELREETGWTIGRISPLGFRHLHHLAPKPDGYAYPHPDFIWSIFTAEAADYQPNDSADVYELEAMFRPFAEAQALGLTRAEQIYLAAAINDHSPVS